MRFTAASISSLVGSTVSRSSFNPSIDGAGTFRTFWFRDGYFTEKGESSEKTMLKTPLKFDRVSSGFDRARMHPVMHTVRAHLGIAALNAIGKSGGRLEGRGLAIAGIVIGGLALLLVVALIAMIGSVSYWGR